MFFSGAQALRVPLRMLPYAVSLAGLLLGRARWTPRHRAEPWLIACIVYLGLMIVHPQTNTVLAGLAQTMLYLSVMAPLFWVPQLVRGTEHLKRILWILLLCNGVNSCVGVLQVHDPGTWLPKELSSTHTSSKYKSGVEFVTARGQRVTRPPGLFDTPGAVCGAGVIAGVLGLVFALFATETYKRAIGFLFSTAGIAAIFFSHVRTSLLILLGSLIVFALALILQRKLHLGFVVALAAFGMAGLAWSFALAVGGESVEERFETLLEDTPLQVYETSYRGPMLRHAFTRLLLHYPAGAGLGRWGMMRVYFGDEGNSLSPRIWAELQIPAWILDGGIVLLSLYSLALVVTTRHQLEVLRNRRFAQMGVWGAATFALCAGTIALSFGFTPFTTQVGLQYWYLIGCFYGASIAEARRTPDWNSPRSPISARSR